jgi:hypothetical protein
MYKHATFMVVHGQKNLYSGFYTIDHPNYKCYLRHAL